MAHADVIVSDRLSLVPLDAALLTAMSDHRAVVGAFTWPTWWPDEADRFHLSVWLERAATRGPASPWGPRAVVERGSNAMVGHAGFHLPPRPIDAALADPSFAGVVDPADGGAVEVGYTIFPSERGRGLATEAVNALVQWAFATGDVDVVLAAIDEHNAPSLAVIQRVGGFRMIGRCEAVDGSTEIVWRRDRTVGG